MEPIITKEGTWEILKIHPTTLMRMVVEGKANIIGKDNRGRYIYRLKEVVQHANSM